MRALVTGGAGFIGSHLVDTLVARGDDVTVLDDLSTGREANLAEARERVRLVRGSILDDDALRSAMDGADVVFHLAAIPSVAVSVREPARTHETNATGTLKVLEAARAARARRLVFASSSAVYGDAPQLPCRETDLPRPLSPYAAQKHAGEMYARVYAEAFGLPTVALRFFNVFGARQSPHSEYAAAVPRFILACLGGSAPTIHGDGGQTRDFVHVATVAEALLRAAEAPEAACAGRAFNIASGRSISINELVAQIRDATGASVEPVHGPAREGDIRHSAASIDEARAGLGFQPSPGAFAAGLKATIAWYQENGDR